MRLSVVIPCYNGGRFLPDAIRSAIESNVEVIVVDDGSADDTAEVARSNGVVLIQHQRNEGIAAALNTGVASSQSDLVMILAADDTLTPGAIRGLVKAAAESPHVDVFLPSVDMIELDTGAVIHKWRHSEYPLDLHRILAKQLPPTCGVVYRRAILVEHSFRPGGSEDWRHWLELATANVTGTAVPDALTLYRARSESESKDAAKKWRTGTELLLNPAYRHPGCRECALAVSCGRDALRDYCFTLDLAQVFGAGGQRRFGRALRAVGRDPAITPRLVHAAAWRLRDRLLQHRKGVDSAVY